MPSYPLYTLRDLRVAGERQAEQELARARAALGQATEEAQRLEARASAARAALGEARGGAAPPGTAAAAQVARRYWARLESAARACEAALDRHAAEVVKPATRAEQTARAAHLRARQKREVVEKAIARREAEARRVRERREEAAVDDRGRPPKR